MLYCKLRILWELWKYYLSHFLFHSNLSNFGWKTLARKVTKFYVHFFSFPLIKKLRNTIIRWKTEIFYPFPFFSVHFKTQKQKQSVKKGRNGRLKRMLINHYLLSFVPQKFVKGKWYKLKFRFFYYQSCRYIIWWVIILIILSNFMYWCLS